MNDESRYKVQNLFYRQIWPGYDKGTKSKRFLLLIAGTVFIAVFAVSLIWPPSDFPVGATIRIDPGSSLKEISDNLKSANFIRSKFAFQFLVILHGGEKRVIANDYFFKGRQNTLTIVGRMLQGETGIVPTRITIMEGLNNSQIAALLASKFSNIKEEQFKILAKDKEGYLFPDTYLFPPNIYQEEILMAMGENFNKKIGPLTKEIDNSGRTLPDIITMASIIEKETGGDDDRKIISGILWKRIENG